MLASSQTFIGILSSLLIVFIILDEKTNFLEKFFKEYLKGIRKNFQRLTKNIEQGRKDIYKDAYNRIQKFHKSNLPADLSEAEKDIIENRINLDYMRLSVGMNNTDIFDSSTYVEKILEKTKSIENGKGRSFAPLSMLVYCLCLLCCDEFVAVFPSLLGTVLLFFLILSIVLTVFYLCLWHKSVTEASEVFPEKRRGKKRVSRDFKRGIPNLVDIIILLFIFIAVSLFAHDVHRNIHVGLLAMIATATGLIFFFVALHHTALRNAQGEYSNSFLFYHGMVIGLLCLIDVAILSFFPYYGKLTSLMVNYHRLFVWMFGLFIIFFGILLPLLCSIISIKMVVNEAENESEKVIARLSQKYESLMNEIIPEKRY